MEKHYQDGTEPTILPHVKGDFVDTYPTGRWCCDNKCEQGRFCPERGTSEPDFDYRMEAIQDLLICLTGVGLIMAIVTVVMGWIA